MQLQLAEEIKAIDIFVYPGEASVGFANIRGLE